MFSYISLEQSCSGKYVYQFFLFQERFFEFGALIKTEAHFVIFHFSYGNYKMFLFIELFYFSKKLKADKLRWSCGINVKELCSLDSSSTHLSFLKKGMNIIYTLLNSEQLMRTQIEHPSLTRYLVIVEEVILL